ncbi:DsbA family protein [Corynebacterium renale]|uniref:Thiol:disulfide interchange protein DsbC n=1 Tax=Corynebacterium renale TaxID=1724 RepID=A0A2A9DQ37_9CORY|nr:thioredoxin domain-containing protein [Corynebacterium renale]PFG28092.1 thiol:disulfide interchange protein DsbC [Corynebacterium renale]SQI20800.1 putative secreted protein [Corynebacterium renale]
MSNSVKNPNQSGKGFMWAIIAVVVIAIVVIAGVVISNKGGKSREWEDVSFQAELVDGRVHLTSENADGSTPKARVYEDFMCPHCAELAAADGPALKDAAEKGDLDVEIAPLGFMDQFQDKSNTTGPSHQALAAVLAALEEGGASDFWNMRAMLMENQTNVRGWDKGDYVDAAKELGVDGAVIDAIDSEKYMDKAAEVAKANADVLQKETGEVSSPRVFIDGKEIQVSNDWVEQYRR